MTRTTSLGACVGLLIAGWTLGSLIRADLAGVRTMGEGEVMFVLSLPLSLVTWLVWLLPMAMLFETTTGEIPRWVIYLWLAVTPVLNWGIIGWLVGRWWDRRATRPQERTS